MRAMDPQRREPGNRVGRSESFRYDEPKKKFPFKWLLLFAALTGGFWLYYDLRQETARADEEQSTRERLEAELDKVRRDQLSISFEPHRVLVEEDRDRVFVHGISTVRTPLGGEVRTARTYEMTVAVSNYAPRLTFLTTYDGEPRTAQVLRRQQEAAR